MWLDGKFVLDAEAKTSLLSHSLHYGGAVYEGIRFYKTEGGRHAIFRLKDHLKRLQASARTMSMETYTIKALTDATIKAVRQSGLEEGYIRPMVFRGEGLGLMSLGILVHTMVAVLPWNKGPDSITLATTGMVRLHPGSTNVKAKVAGHYVNSYLAAAQAREKGADDALLLDWQGDLAETSVANVFIVRGERIFTPRRDHIFPGITRDTVIAILAANDRKVVERHISLDEALQCDAMFVAGTAAEVLPVARLNDRVFEPGHGVVTLCHNLYQRVIRGGLGKTFPDWLTFVD